MRYILGEDIRIDRDTAVTIGKFDGLHIGHMHLLDKLQNIAAERGLATVVLSFSPHPAAFFTGKQTPLILSLDEKKYLLEQAGIDYFIEYPFNRQFAQKSPTGFLEDVIRAQLNCRALIVGEGFRFGAGGRGDVAFAESLSHGLGFNLHAMPHITQDGEKTGSEAIRRYIAGGDLAEAKKAAGRGYFIIGQMAEDGQTISIGHDKILPPDGDYDVIVHTAANSLPAVAKISGRLVSILCADDSLTRQCVRVNF